MATRNLQDDLTALSTSIQPSKRNLQADLQALRGQNVYDPQKELENIPYAKDTGGFGQSTDVIAPEDVPQNIPVDYPKPAPGHAMEFSKDQATRNRFQALYGTYKLSKELEKQSQEADKFFGVPKAPYKDPNVPLTPREQKYESMSPLAQIGSTAGRTAVRYGAGLGAFVSSIPSKIALPELYAQNPNSSSPAMDVLKQEASGMFEMFKQLPAQVMYSVLRAVGVKPEQADDIPEMIDKAGKALGMNPQMAEGFRNAVNTMYKSPESPIFAGQILKGGVESVKDRAKPPSITDQASQLGKTNLANKRIDAIQQKYINDIQDKSLTPIERYKLRVKAESDINTIRESSKDYYEPIQTEVVNPTVGDMRKIGMDKNRQPAFETGRKFQPGPKQVSRETGQPNYNKEFISEPVRPTYPIETVKQTEPIQYTEKPVKAEKVNKPTEIIKTTAVKADGESGVKTPLPSLPQKPSISYRIQHQIDSKNSISADNVNIEDVVKEHKLKNGYLTNYDHTDLKKLKKMQGNPDLEVKIYRASPKNELNNGDWVTTSRTYAIDVKRQNGGKVYSYTVKAGDLRYPKNLEELPSLARFSAFKYEPSKQAKLSSPVDKDLTHRKANPKTAKELQTAKLDDKLTSQDKGINNETKNFDPKDVLPFGIALTAIALGYLDDDERDKLLVAAGGIVALGTKLKRTKTGTAPVWYSKLAENLGKKLGNAKSVPVWSLKQIISSMVKKGEVKAEEVEWTGIEEWLKDKSGKISQKEIAGFIRENQVEVLDVELGKRDGISKSSKFKSYKEPGGTIYRELLLTMPPKTEKLDKARKDFNDYHAKLKSKYGDNIDRKMTIGESEILGNLTNKTLFYLYNTKYQFQKENFISEHFDEPNILAHIRFDKRGKTLFIEEIQSDWHQRGRSDGYTETSGVPDAPFKKTWHELAFKRMMRYAADNGFNKIAWTTGKMQNDRYSLSKQVESIEIMKSHGTYDLRAYRKNARNYIGDHIEKSDLTEQELANYIGKEMAAKAIKEIEIKDLNRKKGDDFPSVLYSGLDLEVGGEGMKGFYDKILPATANKLGKKYGAKVEKTDIGIDGELVHSIDITESMKKSVLEKGLPLFGAALAATALSQSDKDDLAKAGLFGIALMLGRSESPFKDSNGRIIPKSKVKLLENKISKEIAKTDKVISEIRNKSEIKYNKMTESERLNGEAIPIDEPIYSPEDAIESFHSDEKQAVKEKLAQDKKARKKIKPTTESGKIAVKVINTDLSPLYDIAPQKSDIKKRAINFNDFFANTRDVFDRKEAETILRPFDDAKKRFVDAMLNELKNMDDILYKKLKIKADTKYSAAVQKYGEQELINDFKVDLENINDRIANSSNPKETRKLKSVKRAIEKAIKELDGFDYDGLVKKFGKKIAYDIVEADKFVGEVYDRLFPEVNDVRTQIYPNVPNKFAVVKKGAEKTVDGHPKAVRVMDTKEEALDYIKNSPKKDLFVYVRGGKSKAVPYKKNYYRHFRDMSLGGIKDLTNIIDSPDQISAMLVNKSMFTNPKAKWSSLAQERKGYITEYDAVRGLTNYLHQALFMIHIDPTVTMLRGFLNGLENATDGVNNLNNYIFFLNKFQQHVAGKTSHLDRFLMDNIAGRKGLMVLSWINGRVASNVIGGNIGSLLVQPANIPAAIGEAHVYILPGLYDTVWSIFNGTRQSPFMRERFLSEKIDKFSSRMTIKKPFRSAKRISGWLLANADRVGTEIIRNALYRQAIHKGESDPVRYADNKTRELVGGRGLGEMGLAYKSRVMKLALAFQYEVGNLLWVQGRWLRNKEYHKLLLAWVAFHYANELYKKIIGRSVLIDPIEMFMDMADIALNGNIDPYEKAYKIPGRAIGEVLSEAPLGQTVAQAIPRGVRNKIFSIDSDPTRYGSPLLLAKTVNSWNKFLYTASPTGGNQIQKTVEGIKAVKEGAVKDKKGKVKYNIPNNIAEQTKAIVFGKYSPESAQEYFSKKRIKKEFNFELKKAKKNYEEGRVSLSLKRLKLLKKRYKKYPDLVQKIPTELELVTKINKKQAAMGK